MQDSFFVGGGAALGKILLRRRVTDFLTNDKNLF
jgi:hypothetical protein